MKERCGGTMQWRRFIAREGVDITTISGFDVVFITLIRKASGDTKERFFTFLNNKRFTHYIKYDGDSVGYEVYKKSYFSPKQIQQCYDEGLILLRKIKEKSQLWKGQITRDKGTGDKATKDKTLLLQAFQTFRKQFTVVNDVYSITSWFAIEAWQLRFEKMLTMMIKKNKLEDQQELIFDSVYQPWKKTAVREIQEKLQNGIKAEKLVEDYQYLRSWAVVWYRPIDKSWIENLGGGNVESQHVLLSKKELVKLLKPNKEEKEYLTIAPYLTFLKDWRDDVRRTHCYAWSFLFDAIAQQCKVERNDLGYLSLDELEEALQTEKIDGKKITERKAYGCVVTGQGSPLQIKVISGGVNGLPQPYQSIIDEIETETKEQEIRGLIAQSGKVRGKVTIIKTYHDLKKVQIGDILVANTTHPNYLPAMQKAVGFVTNEGGVISHAAIVAREMKKPCIVGTKIATKVLQNGDIVEIDAEKGIVRKVK